ncbi:hydrogenase expression/formation protein HypE [Fodinicola acaciae]|uniref:hydrogenase expression/formation protein HypE n=1 Tax=Fodinicola acaciae TaxID=2681555 RepID=UPI0013D37A79|nr:hydrogenase expression/formation protein HypE [Fodinicola acaciae]
MTDLSLDPVHASCPVPHAETERVLLGHGSGGQLMAELLEDVITPPLGGHDVLEDAAIIGVGDANLAFSTDSFVVTPRFFPGGDIGSLAVYGTVNDLAMRGARPLALSLSYILEEGLPLDELRRITASAAAAARAADVTIVTGDTKVVGRGACDGIYITTTGIGVTEANAWPSAAGGQPGDWVLLSGPIGQHGVAILSAREDLGFDTEIRSDSQPLHRLVEAMVAAGGGGVRTLRDPTRGGLASALNELAAASGVGVELFESDIPVPAQVAAACELLGLDPLHVANEGCLVAFVDPAVGPAVTAAMHSLAEGASARRIGTVTHGPAGRVTAHTLVGSTRIVDMLVGEQLPRIC